MSRQGVAAASIIVTIVVGVIGIFASRVHSKRVERRQRRAEMYQEFCELDNTKIRQSFWFYLGRALSEFLQAAQDTTEDLATDPLSWSEGNLDSLYPSQRRLWKFTCFLSQYADPPYLRPFSQQVCKRTLQFWKKWAADISVGEVQGYGRKPLCELILAVWLELVRVYNTGNLTEANPGLLKLAKKLSHKSAYSFLKAPERLWIFAKWLCTGRVPPNSYSCLHALLKCICRGKGPADTRCRQINSDSDNSH
jgi:hypothetical protein